MGILIFYFVTFQAAGVGLTLDKAIPLFSLTAILTDRLKKRPKQKAVSATTKKKHMVFISLTYTTSGTR
ncbi:hypothetical protein CW304_13420 [Bacillus sp. UFRGS-B20]|nr:hypothetical protein CW304_13420 [Bacillus sp. UFRGS-B20]